MEAPPRRPRDGVPERRKRLVNSHMCSIWLWPAGSEFRPSRLAHLLSPHSSLLVNHLSVHRRPDQLERQRRLCSDDPSLARRPPGRECAAIDNTPLLTDASMARSGTTPWVSSRSLVESRSQASHNLRAARGGPFDQQTPYRFCSCHCEPLTTVDTSPASVAGTGGHCIPPRSGPLYAHQS